MALIRVATRSIETDCHPSRLSTFGGRTTWSNGQGGNSDCHGHSHIHINSTNLRILCATLRQLAPPPRAVLFPYQYASMHHIPWDRPSKSRLWARHAYLELLRRNKECQLREAAYIYILQFALISVYPSRYSVTASSYNSDLDEWTRQLPLMVNWDPASPNEVGLRWQALDCYRRRIYDLITPDR